MKHIYHYLIIGVLLLGVGMGQVGANTIPEAAMPETYIQSGNLDLGGGNTGTATGASTGRGSSGRLDGGGTASGYDANTTPTSGSPDTFDAAAYNQLLRDNNLTPVDFGDGTGTPAGTTTAPESTSGEGTTPSADATTTTPTTAAPSRGLRPQGEMSQPFRPEGVRVPLPSAENSDVRGLLNVYIPSIINFLIGIIAIVAIFMIIWGGYQFLMAQGDTAKVEAAIKTIEWSTTGLTIALLSYIIVQIVVNINIIS